MFRLYFDNKTEDITPNIEEVIEQIQNDINTGVINRRYIVVEQTDRDEPILLCYSDMPEMFYKFKDKYLGKALTKRR
jgi:hypothetical protein